MEGVYLPVRAQTLSQRAAIQLTADSGVAHPGWKRCVHGFHLYASQHRAEEKFVVHRNTKPGVMFADLLKHRATDKCPLMEKTGLETQPGIASAWLQYSPLIAGTEENRESDDIRAGSGQRLV